MYWLKKYDVVAALEKQWWLNRLYLDFPGDSVQFRWHDGLANLFDLVEKTKEAEPATTWLYKAYRDIEPACDAQLLYVGITNNPLSRFVSHGQSSGWTRQTNWVSLAEYSDRWSASAAEKLAIETLAPSWNVQFQNSRDVWSTQKRISWRCCHCGKLADGKSVRLADEMVLCDLDLRRLPHWPLMQKRFVVMHSGCLDEAKRAGLIHRNVIGSSLLQCRTLDDLPVLRWWVEDFMSDWYGLPPSNFAGAVSWDEMVEAVITGVRDARGCEGDVGQAVSSLHERVPDFDTLLKRVGET